MSAVVIVSKCQNLKVNAYSADWADGVPAAGGSGQSEHHEEGGGHPLRVPLPDFHLPGAPLRHPLLNSATYDPSVSQSVFTIKEKAPYGQDTILNETNLTD